MTVMPDGNLGKDTKALICAWLRALELRNAGGDEQKLKEIGDLTVDETLRKWLWVVTIIGAPVSFIGLPIGLSFLGFIFAGWLVQVFWLFVKLSMCLVLVIFAMAVYFTWRAEGK